MELQKLFSFSRYSTYKFWKYKGLYREFQLQMRFSAISRKTIYSSRNWARELKFTQNVHIHVATKVSEGIFDISKIFKMAAIFRPKMGILADFGPKILIFGLKIAAILKIFETFVAT